MANDRFAAWVKETKASLTGAREGSTPTWGPDRHFYFALAQALVFALLTIAIAIHEAAETKKGR